MILSRRYNYSQENCDAIDIHHVQVGRSSGVVAELLVRLRPALALLLLPYALNLFLLKDVSLNTLFWSCLISSFIVILLIQNPIKKESVVILPAFGVQLETHYLSGKVFRRFIPIEKILKPVLLECVTPMTCYWSLAFTVRGEEELMLVFKFVGLDITLSVVTEEPKNINKEILGEEDSESLPLCSWAF